MHDREFKITKAEEGAAFAVYVVPKSVKNEVVGKYGDALKINLASNTVGGIANDTLINFICEKLGVKRDQVEIAGGLGSAEKMVVVLGLSPAEAETRMMA